jgi:SHS2 domain-containing protein
MYYLYASYSTFCEDYLALVDEFTDLEEAEEAEYYEKLCLWADGNILLDITQEIRATNILYQDLLNLVAK